ncbi:MAG: hypothetical protein ACRDRJ_22935 [Streptosporangiaceae bacterium]
MATDLIAVAAIVFLAWLAISWAWRRPAKLRRGRDFAAWLAAKCRDLDQELRGYQHQISWLPPGSGPHALAGACERCQGTVVMTWVTDGYEINYDFPADAGEELAPCGGAR